MYEAASQCLLTVIISEVKNSKLILPVVTDKNINFEAIYWVSSCNDISWHCLAIFSIFVSILSSHLKQMILTLMFISRSSYSIFYFQILIKIQTAVCWNPWPENLNFWCGLLTRNTKHLGNYMFSDLAFQSDEEANRQKPTFQLFSYIDDSWCEQTDSSQHFSAEVNAKTCEKCVLQQDCYSGRLEARSVFCWAHCY